MSAEELERFYAAEYRQLYQGEAGPIQKDLKTQALRANHLVDFVRKNAIPRLERTLDIGASAGLLMSAFQEAFHCEVVGVELGQAYRENAQKSGLQVYPGLADLPASLQGRCDLVSLAHVLEHFADPLSTLAELRRKWLAPGGWLLVEVPNLYCHDSFEVAHMLAYSRHTLSQVVLQAGFTISNICTHGFPRSKALPLYITLLGRAPRDGETSPVPAIRPERLVRLKRQWGFLKRRMIERLQPANAWQDIR